jgi:hypothetical protein
MANTVELPLTQDQGSHAKAPLIIHHSSSAHRLYAYKAHN